MIDPIEIPDLSRLYAAAPGAFISGAYYQTALAPSVTTVATLGNGVLRVAPFIVRKAITITRIGACVTAAGDAGCVLRLGIYADNGNGYPGALILDAGTIPGDAIAVTEVTISTALPAGTYWVGAVPQGVTTTQPTVRGFAAASNVYAPTVPLTGGATPTAATAPALGYSGSGITGALPTTFPASVLPTGSAAWVFVKVA